MVRSNLANRGDTAVLQTFVKIWYLKVDVDMNRRPDYDRILQNLGIIITVYILSTELLFNIKLIFQFTDTGINSLNLIESNMYLFCQI